MDARYKSYRPGLKRYSDDLLLLTDVNAAVVPVEKKDEDKKDGEEKPAKTGLQVDERPAYEVADVLGALLNDRGQVADLANHPNLVEFWNLPDPKISALREQVVAVRQQLRYSHPMLVVKEYGKGRVAAWMSTAGNEWNPWASTGIYAPMLFEMQNYLASQGGSNARLLGPGATVSVDPAHLPPGVTNLRVLRSFYRPESGQPEKELDSEWAREVIVRREPKKDDKKDDKDATEKPSRVFEFKNTPEPGFALVEVFDEAQLKGLDEATLKRFTKANRGDVKSLEEISQVYNVDARREGNLTRVSQDEMEGNLLREANQGRRPEQKAIYFIGPDDSGESLVARPQDLSQTPWFFLFFLAVLIAEQALAVHLSFHLRNNEAELPAQVAKTEARAA